MSQEDLNSLYGELANRPVMAARAICRSRLSGQETFYSVEQLKRNARECRGIARSIERLGGSERPQKRAKKIAEVHEHYAEKPEKLEALVNKLYRQMYKNAEENVSTTDFNDETLMCPYEETGSKKSCWTCHLPSKVWKAMERNYEQEKFGKPA